MLNVLAAALTAALVLLQTGTTQVYRDPGGRFTFSYPSTFGSASRGTNDGFGDRVAAVRFSAFPARLKGEAVLTRGFPLLDFQAAGGLYDAITLEIFPDQVRAVVLTQLPRLSVANLCQALAQPRHLDANLPAFAPLPPAQRSAIGQVDTMRNVNPNLVRCQTADDVVVFDKEQTPQAGGPTQHVFGAVRFLRQPFSTFQLVAGGDAPDPALLTTLADLVKSFALN